MGSNPLAALSTIHYPLSTIHYQLSTIHYTMPALAELRSRNKNFTE
ncbi:MAG: hypothetical protein LBE12_09235 [Planctomycetaceae bacterium]|nr:hypothetical protein [Planctomycetaceae bacterium]